MSGLSGVVVWFLSGGKENRGGGVCVFGLVLAARAGCRGERKGRSKKTRGCEPVGRKRGNQTERLEKTLGGSEPPLIGRKKKKRAKGERPPGNRIRKKLPVGGEVGDRGKKDSRGRSGLHWS